MLTLVLHRGWMWQGEVLRDAYLLTYLLIGDGCGRWSFYAILWTDLLLFHARKHYVAHEIQRKYSTPMVHRHPCLLPGFLILLPELAEALKPLVWADHLPARFPQWVPPGPLGDWEPIAPVHAKAA